MKISTINVPNPIEKKILAAIELKKQLKEYEEEIKNHLLQLMIENNVDSIKNDLYTITLATRKNFKAKDNVIPEQFSKVVLDTSKVGTYLKLYNEIPDDIEVEETKYITWKAKK